MNRWIDDVYVWYKYIQTELCKGKLHPCIYELHVWVALEWLKCRTKYHEKIFVLTFAAHVIKVSEDLKFYVEYDVVWYFGCTLNSDFFGGDGPHSNF